MRAFFASLLIVLAACGSTNNVPSQPAATTCSVSSSSAVPTTAASSTPTPNREAGLVYVCSPERLKAYDDLWPAAEKVAKGIQANKFGPYEARMLGKKSPVPADYIGLVGLYAQDEATFAYVWWQNGAPDYFKGVVGFGLYNVQLDKHTEEFPYAVSINEGTFRWVMSPNFFGGESPMGEFRYPTSEYEAEAIDARVQSVLQHNLQKAGL